MDPEFRRELERIRDKDGECWKHHTTFAPQYDLQLADSIILYHYQGARGDSGSQMGRVKIHSPSVAHQTGSDALQDHLSAFSSYSVPPSF